VLGERLTKQLIASTKLQRAAEATPASELAYDGLLGRELPAEMKTSDPPQALVGRGRRSCVQWRDAPLPAPTVKKGRGAKYPSATMRREAKEAADVTWEL
jgi:hypothetical protein